MTKTKLIGVINPKGKIQTFRNVTELANQIHSENSEYHRTVGMTIGALIRRLTCNLPEGGSYLNYTRLSPVVVNSDAHRPATRLSTPAYVVDTAFHQVLRYPSCREAGRGLDVDFRRVSASILHHISFSGGRFWAFSSNADAKAFLDRHMAGVRAPRVLRLHDWKIFDSEYAKDPIMVGVGYGDLLGTLRNHGSHISDASLASYCSRTSRKSSRRVLMLRSALPTKRVFAEMIFLPERPSKSEE